MRIQEQPVWEETVIHGPLDVSFYLGQVSLYSEKFILLGIENNRHEPLLKDLLPISQTVKSR